MTEDPGKTSLSVLVPVYNEQHLVSASLTRLRVLATSPLLERVEVIVVDDCSTDGTARVLAAFEADAAKEMTSPMTWRFVRHEHNTGKGGAVRTALEFATCEISVIHDADLEYDPRDLLPMVRVFVEESADAVYGSRFAGGGVRRVLLYWHQLGNKLLTLLCNLVTNLNLTDVETCYKAVRTDLLKSIPIVSDDFRLEPELTIKLAKRRARLFEVPISYAGRTYQEGKKIGWRDGYRALGAIVRFALSDEIYKRDTYGSQILARLSRAPNFNAWMADVIRPFCGERVLEIGGGVGNLTLELVPRATFVVSDVNPLYLQTLGALRPQRPYLQVAYCDVTDFASFPALEERYDTVICLNVIEHIAGDEAALTNIQHVLADDGRAIILVPQGAWNFGTLDTVLGHERRYSRQTLTDLAARSGFTVERMIEFNRVGTFAWWLNGRALKRRTFGLLQVKLLNWLTPLIRQFDAVLPTPPLSLIAILRPTHRDATGVVTNAAQPPKVEEQRTLTTSLRSMTLTAWVLVVLAVTWLAYRENHFWVKLALPNIPSMCRGLPQYDAFAGYGDPKGQLIFATDNGPRFLERHFCAQYVLAPTSLYMLRSIDRAVLLAHVRLGPVLVDGAEDGVLKPSIAAVIEDLRRSGEVRIAKQTPDGLVLLTIP